MADFGSKEADREGAPFNMALDTLKRIGDILRDIKAVSTNPELSLGVAQYSKYRLTRQLFVQATPLIKDDTEKTKLAEKLAKIKLKWVKNINQITKRPINFTPSYSDTVEEQLDALIVDIQGVLQKDKYFMPPKNDPRFGWSQNQ